MTPAIAATLSEWAVAFLRRWSHQPPEFSDVRYLDEYEYLYRRNIEGHVNPIYADWFPRLVEEATAADLALLETALGTEGGKKGYLRFFQYELMGVARQADQEGRPCSAILPGWFRNKGWGVERWRCEGDAPVPPSAPAALSSRADLEKVIATLRATADSLEASLVS